ncbi:MlaD family protein [Melioribacteraceae bacterium 4301-Me]|uniref:MlaD family protein n=1 Tax=Pyranulibacter aquaticus TaxID=3163344 RepID=UPI00359690A3
MTTKQNEFIIGITISLAVIMLIATTLWLGKSNFLSKGMQLNLIVENADGIQKGDEIYFRGVKIGNVLESSIVRNGVVLNLKIDEIDKIPIDSKFEICDFSLISGKAIQIEPGISNQYFLPGDTVKGSTAYGVNQAIASIKDLTPKINKVLSNLDALTGNEVKDKVELTLNNLNCTISHLNNEVNGNLKNILAIINDITSNNKGHIDSLFLSLNNNSVELSKFLNKSSDAVEQLNSLLTSMNEGKGSLGSLLKNDTLYHNLTHSISSIDSLVTDIKRNPKKYINVSVF